MGRFAVDVPEMNAPRTVETMLVRRTVAVLALAALGAMAGCDDGPPSATVGNPSASSSSTRASDLAYPTYVALGDSYTAAPGVPQTEQETGCLRSNGNYASLVANQLKSDFVDVSCTGASTVSLIGAQHSADHVYPPQFAALSADTSLVTLGIGGNDLKLFETMVGTCGQFGLSDPDGSPCRDYMKDAGKKKDLLAEKIDKVGGRVTAALKGIHDRSPQAKVLLVGYPQPVPAKGTCRILPIARGDYPYVRGLVVKLNDALRTAAKKAKADFVDMVKASKGHDVCAGPDAWVNGVNTDLMRALAFHPFAAEQQAVADLIMKKLDTD
jgi:lysophospholipase L1-like esterase